MKTNNPATVAPATVTVKPVSTFLKGFVTLFAFLSLMGFVGTIEYNDELYYSIPDAAFEEIILKLGDNASRQDVITEYITNMSYYQSFN